MKIYFRFTSILILVTFCYLASCAQKVNIKKSGQLTTTAKLDSIFTVRKIDSINNYYFIYAKRNNKWFKIVSKKEKNIRNNKIKINTDYRFSLHSIWNEKVMIGGINVSPSQTPYVTCLGFEEKTMICIERDSINDLFSSKNLNGLNYIKNKEKE